MYKSLAIDFKERIALAQIRDTQKDAVKEFNVEQFPTLIILPGGSASGIVYTGELERDPMFQFLSQFVPVASPAESPVKSKPKEATGSPIVYETDGSRLQIRQDQ